MPTAPTPLTVARSRYWVAAALRAAGLVLALCYGVKLAMNLIALLISLVTAGFGGPLATLPELWQLFGWQLVWTVVGVVLIKASPRVAKWLLPSVGAICDNCGYSRRGLLTAAPCPECGFAPADAAARSKPAARP